MINLENLLSELENFGLRKALVPVRELEVNALDFRTLKFVPDADYSNNKLYKVSIGDFTLKCSEAVKDAIDTNDVALVGLFEFTNDKKELIKYARITGVK
jgi:hypothetical protein